MFGKRGGAGAAGKPKPLAMPPEVAAAPAPAPQAAPPAAAQPKPQAAAPAPAPAAPAAPPSARSRAAQKSENYYDVKTQVFAALIDTIDLSQLSKLDAEGAREEIRDIVNDIIAIKSILMSIAEQ